MLSWLIVLGASGVVLWVAKPHRWGAYGSLLAGAPAAAAFGWLLARAIGYDAESVATESVTWLPAFDLELALRLDGLALFFSLIITGIGAAIAVYAGGYFRGGERFGYFLLLLYAFMVSMLGLVWADNLLALFSFWEATSITSFLLIGFSHTNPKAQSGARRSLVVTGLGGLAMLGGFVILGNGAGTFTISELAKAEDLTAITGYTPAVLLIMLGAFTKSAQFPFHFWLPGAMAAPTPASAYLHSATMVKAGVYLLARMHPALGSTDLWFWTLAVVGGVTMVVGATQALGQTDLKALLASATVSQLGVLVFLLAFDSKEAYKAVVVGILAHALYKGPLFMVAGIIDLSTKTRLIDRLAELAKSIPIVAGVAVAAAVSMAGLPPLFGFLSKETLLEVPIHEIEEGRTVVGWVGLVVVALTGAFFVAYSFRLIWEPFFRPKTDAPDPDDVADVTFPPGPTLWGGPLVLVAVGTLIPFISPLIEDWLFSPAATDIAGKAQDVEPRLWLGFTPALGVSVLAIAAGYVLFRYRTPTAEAITAYPKGLEGDRLFDKAYDGSYRLARRVTVYLQDRSISSHASVVLILVVGSMGAALVYAGDVDLFANDAGFPRPYVVVIALVAMVAAVEAATGPSQFSRIIALGVVGVMVTLIFIEFSAPDLALTQLAVDILTVVLLVFVFHRIDRRDQPDQLPWPKLAVSGAVGLFGLLAVLLAGATTEFTPISDEHLVTSLPDAQGANVVNVILVDFRAFDTFGEIAVLAIAAVGGFGLLRSGKLFPIAVGNGPREPDPNRPPVIEDAPPLPPSDGPVDDLSELYLRTFTTVLTPLLGLLILWLLWRGHNEPGGGFIAGLVAAAITQLQILSRRETPVRRRLGPYLQPLTGIGLLAAIGSALWGLAGGPLFTGLWTELDLGFTVIKLGTPLIFDIGVFLVVFSVVSSFLLGLSRGNDQLPLIDPTGRDPWDTPESSERVNS